MGSVNVNVRLSQVGLFIRIFHAVTKSTKVATDYTHRPRHFATPCSSAGARERAWKASAVTCLAFLNPACEIKQERYLVHTNHRSRRIEQARAGRPRS